MKKNIKTIIVTAAMVAITIPAFAATATSTKSHKAFEGSRGIASTTRATSTQARITNDQNRGTDEINTRLNSLLSLYNRVQDLKNVSDADKASIKSNLQQEVASLNALRMKIASDTSTSTIKADIQSIISANRVYALVIPKTQIIIAADRTNTLVTMISAVIAKVQLRIASSSVLVASSTQALLSDMSAKLTDASAQAKAATAEVVSLIPDNGDKKIAASNKVALKDAKKKIQAAQQDIVIARKDLESVRQILSGNMPKKDSMATTTPKIKKATATSTKLKK